MYADLNRKCSSGPSGQVRGGGQKHEIYAAALGFHNFYGLFFRAGGHGGGGDGCQGPLAPGSPAAVHF